MAVTCPKDTYGSLKKSLVFHTLQSHGVSVHWLTLYRNVFDHFLFSCQRTSACQPIKIHLEQYALIE